MLESGGRVVSALSVRCIRSCAPFCSGCRGTIRSTLMPSRIHYSESLESLARPGDPNGLQLYDRIARGRPYSRKIRSNAPRVRSFVRRIGVAREQIAAHMIDYGQRVAVAVIA